MKVDDRLLKKSLNAAIDYSVMQKEGKKPKTRNFDESVDFMINLKDVDLKQPQNRIDKELILPHDITNAEKPSICVIASDEVLLKAKNLDLDTLDQDDLEQLNRKEKKEKKKFVKEYKFFVVEAKMMPLVARYLARFLGPLGKMPKPFPAGYGIIQSPDDLETVIDRYKRVVRIQVKKHPIVQVKLGKKTMENEAILENMKTVVDYVADQMPHKYNNFKSMYVKTTMGKPIKIDEDFLEEIEVK